MATAAVAPNLDKLSNEDLTTLAETYQHLKTAGDPRADRVGAFIGSQVRAGNVEPLTDQTKQSIAAYGFTPANILKNAWEGMKSVAAGAYAMGKDLATNPDWVLDSRDAQGNVTNKSTLEKFAFDPADAAATKAKAAYKAGNYVEAAGHAMAAGIPFIGPAAENIGEQAGTGDVGGALAKGAAQAATPAFAAKGVGMARSAAAPLLKTAAEKMYQSALKPSTTNTPAQVQSMVQTGLQHEIPVSEAGSAKLGGLINDLNNRIADQIKAGGPRSWPQPKPGQLALPAPKDQIVIPGSADPATPTGYEPARAVVRDPKTGQMKRVYLSGTKAPVPDVPQSGPAVMLRNPESSPAPAMAQGKTIDPAAVVRRLDQMRSKFANQVNPEEDLAAIDAAKQEFLKNNPDAIPVSQAQALKQGTYQQLKGRSYGELRSATIESQKALARGIKEELNQQFPELKDLNAQDSKFYGLDTELDRAVNRISNRNMISLGGRIASGGIGAAMGHGDVASTIGAMTATTVLHEVITNPALQTKLAIAMSKASKGKVTFPAARARVMSYVSGLQAATAATSQGRDDQTSQ